MQCSTLMRPLMAHAFSPNRRRKVEGFLSAVNRFPFLRSYLSEINDVKTKTSREMGTNECKLKASTFSPVPSHTVLQQR